ncbi:unnamed protein product [Arctia plantaginis]|uniref:N-acetyltransferase domain-containing protein n=1 Tax=Arctia plantaginis TaxID=874455 RepID=A0A8S0YSP4_ARCPL|nr:unnamed protein product [Arctia plantaginis]CAB3241330.1 unnamed protein product [Arctia plantaginis]
MSWVNAFKTVAVNVYTQNSTLRTGTASMFDLIRRKSTKSLNPNRHSSICRRYPKDRTPCFDPSTITIEYGRQCHARLIRSFLYTEHWPREPSVVGLWMPLESPYLDTLTDMYSYSGDRFLAYERIKRTNERKLVGVCVCTKQYPWMIDELEEWAHVTASRPERHRMYFCAHCLKSPNFFKKYNVDFIYEIEVLCVAQEVASHGVGLMLVKKALAHAEDLRYPLVQNIAVSQYTASLCERAGMKRDWTMDYSEFVDAAGQRVFFPRRPHHTVGIYVKYFDPKKSLELPCKKPF